MKRWTLIPLQFPSLPIRKDLYKTFLPQHIGYIRKYLFYTTHTSYSSFPIFNFPWIQPATDGVELYFLLEIICFSVDKRNSKASCLRVNCIHRYKLEGICYGDGLVLLETQGVLQSSCKLENQQSSCHNSRRLRLKSSGIHGVTPSLKPKV